MWANESWAQICNRTLGLIIYSVIRDCFPRLIAAGGAAPPLSFESPMGGILHAIPRFFRPATTISPPPKLSFLTPGRRRVSVAVYLALPSSEKEEIRSPELVAREYADLNLTDKFCEVAQLWFSVLAMLTGLKWKPWFHIIFRVFLIYYLDVYCRRWAMLESGSM